MPIPSPELADTLPQGKARGAPQTTVVSMKARGVVTQPEDRHRARVADRPFLLEHDILKVRNIDDVTWQFTWDRRKYDVAPGQVGFVPFPALVMKMGDPRSVDGAVTRFLSDDGQRGIIPTRYESLTTLFAHYGIANENIDELCDFAPKMEIRTMDGDELVQFPVQNPKMAPWPVPQAAEPGREGSDTRRLIDNLQEENRQMSSEIAEMREMISGRLDFGQAPPVGRPDPAVAVPDQGDDLASALTGAPVDRGPSAQIG
jgi:hypothetical protein